MKYLFIFIFTALLLIPTVQSSAQRRRPFMDLNRPNPERLEKFRKMRLIEVLKLNEEDAVRYFAKQSAHEGTQRDLMKQRNEALDAMENNVREKNNTHDLQTQSDKLLEVDRKIFAERQRYQDELRKFLTPEQFAKFLVFERNFGRQVKDAIEEMHGESHQKDGQ
jgi:hypothetical protein